MKTNLARALAMLMALTFLTLSCKGKTEQAPPPPEQKMETPSPHGMTPSVERVTEIPDSVKGKWSAVKIEVLFKEKNEKKQFDIPLDSAFPVPDSDIAIAVGQFFPEFTLEGNKYTSVSNEPKNPATRVEITQKDTVIFKGWLFSNYPDVHPFENEKYGVTLVGGVPAK